METSRLVKRISPDGLARSVAFSPDGSLLAVGELDSGTRLYSTESWRQVGRPLEGHTQRVTYVDFSPDGRTLLTASADGTVRLWDVETHTPIGSPLTIVPDTFVAAAFGPDGRHLFAVSTHDRGLRLDTDPESWKQHACLVAGRELSADEWENALPDRGYRAVCSGG